MKISRKNSHLQGDKPEAEVKREKILPAETNNTSYRHRMASPCFAGTSSAPPFVLIDFIIEIKFIYSVNPQKSALKF